MEMKPLLICVSGLCIRIMFLVYGIWQDSTMKVKYTDVDYYVFSDAAAYSFENKSPYLRETYRYTPLLSWILIPNHYWKFWGKCVFIFFDMLTAFITYKLVFFQTKCQNTALTSTIFWLFNPIVITVSSRGNAESIMAFLVSLMLYTLLTKNIKLCGFLFALSVHFKIYPIIYVLSILLYLGNHPKTLIEYFYFIKKWEIKKCINSIVTKDCIIFLLSSFLSFIILTYSMYYYYGRDFLKHTYLYHLTRRDIRHNFSVYFYMFYLKGEFWVGLITFISQILVLLVLSFNFYNDVPFCCFLLTFSFVTFNKICTSQYFLWYLSLLPLLYTKLSHVKIKSAVTPLSLWLLGQALWLGSAYTLEFVAINSFLYIWIAGVLFFMFNIWILGWFIKEYDCTKLKTF